MRLDGERLKGKKEGMNEREPGGWKCEVKRN